MFCRGFAYALGDLGQNPVSYGSAIQQAVVFHGVISLWRDAAEIGRIIDAALALVSRNLRVRTQRSGSHDLIVDDSARGDGSGRGVFLHPVDDCGHGIVAVRTDATAAVRHAGNHEQPEEVFRAGAILLRCLFIVVNARHRLQDGVRPAIRHEQLAAALPEFRKIRILRIGQLAPVVEQVNIGVVS